MRRSCATWGAPAVDGRAVPRVLWPEVSSKIAPAATAVPPRAATIATISSGALRQPKGLTAEPL